MLFKIGEEFLMMELHCDNSNEEIEPIIETNLDLEEVGEVFYYLYCL